MSEFAFDRVFQRTVLDPDESTTFHFGPPTPGHLSLLLGAEDVSDEEIIPEPDGGPGGGVSLDDGFGDGVGLSDGAIASLVRSTDSRFVDIGGGTGFGDRPRQPISPGAFHVEIIDDDGETRASGPAPLNFEVTGRQAAEGPVSDTLLRVVGPPKWQIKITNTSQFKAKVNTTVLFRGRRPILTKDIDLGFLNEKLDLIFNTSRQFQIAFVDEGKRSYIRLIAHPAWVELYPELSDLEVDLGEGVFAVETQSQQMTVRATTHDGSLAFRLRADFPSFRGAIDVLNAVEALTSDIVDDLGEVIVATPIADRPTITISRLGLDIFLVLRPRGFFGPLESRFGPHFEVIARPRLNLNPKYAELVVDALLQVGFERLLPEAAVDAFSKNAVNLLGWLLGDRDREVTGSREQLALHYAGDPQRPISTSPDEPLALPLEPGNLDKIDHIVVLMMENRSFDHMLGFLSLPTSGHDGRVGLGRADVNGLHGDETNLLNIRGDRGRIFPLSTPREGVSLDNMDNDTRGTRFPLDPGHGFEATKAQRGDYNIELMRVLPRRVGDLLDEINIGELMPQSFYVGPNDGFILDFGRRISGKVSARDEQILRHEVMGYHPAEHVPTYRFLAEQYAICDNWFASHPGATWPNRFITLTGALAPGADGKPQIGNPDISTFDPLEVATIFDHLSDAGVDWRYYEHDFCMLRLFSRHTLDQERIVSVDDPERGFYAAARRGELPPVAFIDPDLTDIPLGNDDHPPADIQDGQALVSRIYEALSTSPQWQKILFIITYDEHGGFYDHVHPASQPIFDPAQPERSSFVPLAIDPQSGNPIDFYGMRVPSLVVSPWVRAGEVSKAQYDHTTILKTIMARFLPENPPDMGRRVALAQDLGALLSRDTPRSPPSGLPESAFHPDRRVLASARIGPPSDDFRAFLGAFRRRMRD